MRTYNLVVTVFFSFILFGSIQAQTQSTSQTQPHWGLSYHQSVLPLVGVNYTFAERFMPELRLGTDRYLYEVLVEGTFNYQYVQREEYMLYFGLGFIAREYVAGAVVPAGILLYPFENKKFGFHVEATPIFLGGGTPLLRVSWGIRYRFLKE